MSLQMLLITTKEEVEGYLEEDDEFPINDVTTTTTFNTTTQVILCIRFCILTIFFLKDELEFKKVFGGLYIYVLVCTEVLSTFPKLFLYFLSTNKHQNTSNTFSFLHRSIGWSVSLQTCEKLFCTIECKTNTKM